MSERASGSGGRAPRAPAAARGSCRSRRWRRSGSSPVSFSDRLLAAGEIDDRQAAHAEADAGQRARCPLRRGRDGAASAPCARDRLGEPADRDRARRCRRCRTWSYGSPGLGTSGSPAVARRSRVTFAGMPVAMANSGMSPTTTAPAPMIASRPMRRSVGDDDVRAEPGAVADVDAARGAALLQHRDVDAVVEVIAADEIGVGRHQDVLADAHARGREDLAVEADVGAIVDARCRRSCSSGSCCGRRTRRCRS